ncbi:MAG: DNA polymerase III subunit alpha [Gammaproteobacteria bacterium]|nr:DNA polymerase III subunit alpha [Gammaproteobacteria bacterium]
MEPFVHLRLHSEYSLVDGLIKVDRLAQRAADLGMPAVALTDRANLFALIKFYRACQEAGVKPVVGCEVWVESQLARLDPTRMVLLVQSEAGYRNLIRLVSRAAIETHGGPSLIRREWLRDAHEGLIALCGGPYGEIGTALQAGNSDAARGLLEGWMQIFPERFYLEVMRTGRAGEEDHLHQAVALAAEFACPVVATNDVCFLDADDFEAHETRVCIHEGRRLDDPRRPRRHSPEQYLKSGEDMQALFADLPEALENSSEIAKRCSLELTFDRYFLPQYPAPDGKSLDDLLVQAAGEGLDERLAYVALEPEGPCSLQAYQERLAHELGIISQMGYAGYFLIVMEFIRWAKDHGIPVGPGRGSAAASLVAYSLGITGIDPLEYDLLFERFLNPERVSLPDIDVDFCMDRRDEVIQHVAELYGHDAVSQIVTFGTMAAKAVVRDVARVQGKPYGLADRLAKLIPFQVGITLAKALEQSEELRQFIDDDEDSGEIMEMAFKLEGTVRNMGKHAGGVVIAPTKLTDLVPVIATETGGTMTQFDMVDVEAAGLVKFDFLGLKTLTVIDWAVNSINEGRGFPSPEAQREKLDIDRIPLDDAAVFEGLKKGETTAVFQLESRGMRDLIRKLLPDGFEDIIALVALFRPGPLQSGMVDDFIDRKHGRSRVSYLHPELEPVLRNTYGVILYQEQVMQVAQALAGFTLGRADLLRQAMGKKKPEEMALQREAFVTGAVAHGLEESSAAHIFDLMEKFAGYGFPKPHATAYALVAYQTAWLKTRYPAQFMAAAMSAEMQQTDKVVTLIDECRAMGQTVRPPDVNHGLYRFTVDDGDIVYGLGAIKGLGEGPVEALVDAREADGAFCDLFDFCERTDPRKLNKRALEALIHAGALDCLAEADNVDYARARLLAEMGDALRQAEQTARNQALGMRDLFGEVVSPKDGSAQVVRPVRSLKRSERLAAERDTLGIYITGHPLDDYLQELREFAPVGIRDLKATSNTQTVGGLVMSVRNMRSRRGENLSFLQLDDASGRMEVSVFPDVLATCRGSLENDEIIVVQGEVSMDDFTGELRMRAEAVFPLVEARQRFAQGLVISVCGDHLDEDFCARLHSLLAPHRASGCRVALDYRGESARARVWLGDEWRVRPSDDLLLDLRESFGDTEVRLAY